MLQNSKLISFLATTNVEESKTFYTNILGLTLKFEDVNALVFDVNGSPLRISIVRAFTPHPFTSLGFIVKDIELRVKLLVGAGIEMEQFPGLSQINNGIWVAPDGTKVVWFKDPDGNLLSLTEFKEK